LREKEIYEPQLKSKLEPQNVGKFLVIDIDTGDYEMDEDDLSAALRAYAKSPDGARFEMQIGYPASLLRLEMSVVNTAAESSMPAITSKSTSDPQRDNTARGDNPLSDRRRWISRRSDRFSILDTLTENH